MTRCCLDCAGAIMGSFRAKRCEDCVDARANAQARERYRGSVQHMRACWAAKLAAREQSDEQTERLVAATLERLRAVRKYERAMGQERTA